MIPLSEYKLLIQKVHEPQWIIGYRYGAECTSAERANKEELKEAISKSLRTWLEPLKKLDTELPIVDKFVYVLQPDFAPAKPDGRYNPDLEEDLRQWREVDLRVTFQCIYGRSFVRIGLKFQPAIAMQRGTNISYQLLAIFAHELGHAFGLADTYTNDNLPTQGGLNRTVDLQPASVMAMTGSVHGDKTIDSALAITEDDVRGMIWIYNHFYKGVRQDDCFFADYSYRSILATGVTSCVPKHPLIFEVKFNDPMHALQILKDDPSIDINAQDASGMTALHYAVLYNKMEVVKALLAHQDIKPLLRNKQGDTPYDIALAAGHQEFLKMLPAPPRRKEDVNDDGVVNILDLVAVAAKFGEENAGNADINGDGQVNIQDLVAVAAALGEG